MGLRLNHIALCVHRLEEVAKGRMVTERAVEALNIATKLMLPNVVGLLKIISVLPVTSCEAERTFSRMKLIKSDLRTTMTNNRYKILPKSIHRHKHTVFMPMSLS